MWRAIELVANGEVDAVVSAGNTGALMAMSKLQMRMIEGVTRPAIAGFFPNPHGQSCVLDLGANIECDAENLIQFAIMGSAFYRDIHGGVSPSVGLLNVGEEDQKGFDYLREAAAVLGADSLNLNYHGFVEGSDIAGGKVDVVVLTAFRKCSLENCRGCRGSIPGWIASCIFREYIDKTGLSVGSFWLA